MSINYHKIDSKILQYNLDSIEFKFGMWITKKEFGQRLNLNNQLPKGQFYMSVRVVSKDINTTDMIARRLIKEFTKLEVIRLISKSNNPKNGSVYEYLVQAENNTVENIVTTQLEHSKSQIISGIEDVQKHSNNTGVNTVDNTSKKKSKSKEKNKKEKDTGLDKIIDSYTQDKELINTIRDFLKMRKAIKKPMTDRALKIMLNKLDKYADTPQKKIKILENSIENSWQGVFPLKDNCTLQHEQKKITDMF